ncbi:MAG: hypothetical protein IJX94_02920 [Clostridia bacterium]|nr:hypothetical protein [Clostridia bacterium]
MDIQISTAEKFEKNPCSMVYVPASETIAVSVNDGYARKIVGKLFCNSTVATRSIAYNA